MGDHGTGLTSVGVGYDHTTLKPSQGRLRPSLGGSLWRPLLGEETECH